VVLAIIVIILASIIGMFMLLLEARTVAGKVTHRPAPITSFIQLIASIACAKLAQLTTASAVCGASSIGPAPCSYWW